MRLSDTEIKRLLKSKELIIEPFPDIERISGVSLDLRLGSKIRLFSQYFQPSLDLGSDKSSLNSAIDRMMSKEIELSRETPFFLPPGELVLAVTEEYFELPKDLVGWLDGRSSLGRLGLMVHVTAHRIDPGWKGAIVLECHNVGKIALGLRKGMCIGAVSFEKIYGQVEKTYGSRKEAKYYRQNGPTFSAIDQEGDSLA